MDWIKIIHILAVMGWMAGIFVAPRGLIYWKRAGDPATSQAGELTFRVWRFSAGLGVIAVITGIWLAVIWGFPGWAWLKLGLVALLAGHYAITGVWVMRARRGIFKQSDLTLRLFNEASVIGAIAILWVVVFKPFS